MERYWNEKAETMPADQKAAVQGERLRNCVKRVYDNVKTYRGRMDEQGIEPGDIKGIEDISKLPFMYKTDLRDNYPYGLFACGMDDIIRIHASSGTTGKTTVVGYTRNDIDMWNECMARALTRAGLGKSDIVHVSYGYGLFTGGLGGHYGAETIGASVIPVSVGNTSRQLQIMEDFGSTALLCTPSYAMLLGDAVNEAGILDKLSLKVGVFGAEPWTENMRKQIEARLNLSAFDIYGLSELCGPGVSSECRCKDGMHIEDDHFFPEIIDPDTAEPLPEGSQGELVFSCISKEALPLIRYRTRDLSSLNYKKCACGRTSARMSKIKGRSDDMLIIRGVNVFPSQVESVLLTFAEVAPHYRIVVDRVNNLDTFEIQVEMTDELFSDEIRGIEAIERRIRRGVESTLGLSAKIKLVTPRSIARSEGKAKRVIDNRNIL